jgi:hypothetical protein
MNHTMLHSDVFYQALLKLAFTQVGAGPTETRPKLCVRWMESKKGQHEQPLLLLLKFKPVCGSEN